MRSILLGLSCLCALVSSSVLPTVCNFENADDIAPYITCGNQLSISQCLVQMKKLELIEGCLTNAGCSEMQAATAAEHLRGNCFLPVQGEDLRKRQKGNDKEKTTAAPKTTEAPKTIDDPATTAQPTTSAAAPTTTDAPTTTASPSTTETPSPASTESSAAPSTTQSTTAPTTAPTTTPTTSPTTTSTMATTGTTSPVTTPLVCLSTSQMSTTWCITTTAGGSTASTCVPTTTPIIACAPGLLCQTQSADVVTCMVLQNNLTTSGLVVSIIFGLMVLGFIVALCIMCYKSDQLSRQNALKREAAMIASMKTKNARDVEASSGYPKGRGIDAASSEAHLPLMAAQGPAGGSRDRSADYSATRPTAHRTPSGSYQDIIASRTPSGAPKLHPGLMDVGVEEDDMGYGRGRQ